MFTRITSRIGSFRVRLFGIVALVGLAGAACASDARQTTLEPQGPAARQIDNLSNATFIIAGIVFVIVQVGVLYVVWRFRKRKNDDENEMPKQLHGNTKAEVAWTIMPALILVGLAIPTVTTVLDLAREPDDALHVRVVGQQWWWSYDYDINGNGIFADNDLTTPGYEFPEELTEDIETANELVIPVNTPVYLHLESRDVIHSFWIPALNGKMDAVPGRTNHLVLEADEPGTYVGQCTEYCGLSHAYMHMTVRALPEDEFDEWVENQLQPAAEPQTALAREGRDVFAAQCVSCHYINGVNEDFSDGAAALTSAAAPNLTHFADRGTFAGGIFDLWVDQDGNGIIEADEIGVELNRNQLAAWLRNPPAEKPMSPDDGRGMPDLDLNEAEIDALVEYLAGLE